MGIKQKRPPSSSIRFYFQLVKTSVVDVLLRYVNQVYVTLEQILRVQLVEFVGKKRVYNQCLSF